MEMKNQSPKPDLANALIDPGTVFSSPEEVLKEKNLGKMKKIEILRRWEYDTCEESVAEEEGMKGGIGDNNAVLLQSIIRALESLTGGLDLEHTPPTKQGGLDRMAVKQKT